MSLLQTKGRLNFSQVKKISSLFGLSINYFQDIKGETDLKTNINFDLSKQFKIENLSYSIEGDIPYLEIHTEEKRIIKKYLPEYDPKLIIKDADIKFINSKSDHEIQLNGFIKKKDKFDKFKIKEFYDYNKKVFNVNVFIDLTNSKVEVSRLNYNKDFGKKSNLFLDVIFSLDKYYNIKELRFNTDESEIDLVDIKLNNNFEVENFKKLKIKTYENGNKNNDFLVEKLKKTIISGEVFDAQPLLKSLYKKSVKKTFSSNFSSEVKINFRKTLTGTNDDVSNFAMIANINKGSYNKLSLKGNFSDKEIIEMSIYQVDKDKKTLQVISDRARPFIKNFDFVKGFEGGKLEYESTISKKKSINNQL